MAINPTTKARIEAAIVTAGLSNVCPLCGGAIELLPGLTLVCLQPDAADISLAGSQSPMALRGCGTCGFTMQFNLGVLAGMRHNTAPADASEDAPWD